jgi:predicted RNase H-like nuclease (RuvC/YqgF family)
MDVYVERNEMLESKVSELSSQARQDQAEIENLHIALQQREERVDELMREQDREEDEVYAKDDIIERLRKRLAESDKSRVEAERRYQDQVSTRMYLV